MEGTLQEKDFPQVLMECYEKGLTGELLLENGNIKKTIFFLKGHPVFARSNAHEDKIGRVILENAEISREDIEKALKIAKKTGKKIGLVLVKMNLLNPGDLYDLVITQVRRIIFSIFVWENGNYKFIEQSSLPKEVITLEDNPGAIIINGIKKYYSEERLIKQLRTFNLVFKRVKSPYFALTSLPVTEEEIEVLKTINGKDSIKEIIRKLPFPRKTVLSSIYFFYVLKFIEPLAESLEQEELYTEQRLKRILENFHHTTMFQWLGVTPDALQEDIIEAYTKLSRRFGREYLPAYLSEEVIDLAGKIFNRITEAYHFLVDDNYRNYYAGLIEKGASAEEVRLLVKKKYAKDLFEEGKKFYKEGKIHKAYEKFKNALEHDPDEADYYTAIALTDLTDYEGYEPDYDEAEKMLKEAISRAMDNPRNYFYLGQMYKYMGNFILARKYLQEALEVAPDYIFARRALKEVDQLEKKMK